MNTKLARILLENKDVILENWLAELEIPPPLPGMSHGEVSYDYLENLFEELLSMILLDKEIDDDHIPFHAFMDYTFTCLPGRPACVDLHRAGQMAFKASLDASYDDSDTFTETERAVCKTYIDNALAVILHKEIEACCKECAKPFCPFGKSEDFDSANSESEFNLTGVSKNY